MRLLLRLQLLPAPDLARRLGPDDEHRLGQLALRWLLLLPLLLPCCCDCCQQVGQAAHVINVGVGHPHTHDPLEQLVQLLWWILG
jgi:hypothetical protein